MTPRSLAETPCNNDLPGGSRAVEPPPLEEHQTMITSRRSRIPGAVEPRLLKLKDACAYLGGLSPSTVRRLIARGLLKPNHALRHITISREELDRFVREGAGL